MSDEEGQSIKMQCSSSGHPSYKQQSALNLSTTIWFLFWKFRSADFFTFYCFVLFFSCLNATLELQFQHPWFKASEYLLSMEILNFSFSLIDIQTNIKNNNVDKWQTNNHRLDLCAITKQGMWNNRCKEDRR